MGDGSGVGEVLLARSNGTTVLKLHTSALHRSMSQITIETMSQKQCHRSTVAEAILLKQCHRSNVTEAMLQTATAGIHGTQRAWFGAYLFFVNFVGMFVH